MKKIGIILILLCGLSTAGILAARPSGAESAANKEVSITVSAVGDCTFGSDSSSPASVNFYAVHRRVKDNGYFLKKVSSVFQEDDLTIANLEGTLTKRGSRADKKYAFRGSPSYANILKKGSVEAVSFANNHCRDYGSVSYSDTIAALKKADIRCASYSKISTYTARGKKIGMVAVNGLEGEAGSKNLIHKGIRRLKKKRADIIIVSMHAGTEYEYSPGTTQKNLGHYAVSQGADLVLGHHPHVLQGIECYKGSYIVYSLGNFCFGGNTNPRDKDTMIFRQTFTFRGNKILKKKSYAEVIPCSLSSASGINNYQPEIAAGKRYRRILKRLRAYSKPLGISFEKKKGKLTGRIVKAKK